MAAADQQREHRGAFDITPDFARQIIAASVDCIKILDLDGNLLYMSPGGQKCLEIDDISKRLNRCWIDVWVGTDRESARAAVEAAGSGRMGRFQGYCPTAKGKPKWWDVVITPLRDAAGQVECLLSISRDITELKQADEEVKRQGVLIQELSTPVLAVEEGLLVVPLIGRVDPGRGRQLTEQLLKAIRSNRAKAVVIDVTGVLTIDTAGANNLVQAAKAARLLGAAVILTGISREIAQTLVMLGVQLGTLRTAGDLRSGIEQARGLLAHEFTPESS